MIFFVRQVLVENACVCARGLPQKTVHASDSPLDQGPVLDSVYAVHQQPLRVDGETQSIVRKIAREFDGVISAAKGNGVADDVRDLPLHGSHQFVRLEISQLHEYGTNPPVPDDAVVRLLNLGETQLPTSK